MTFELDEVVSVCVLVEGEDVHGRNVQDDCCVVGGVGGGCVRCVFCGVLGAPNWGVGTDGRNGLGNVETLNDGHEGFVAVLGAVCECVDGRPRMC